MKPDAANALHQRKIELLDSLTFLGPEDENAAYWCGYFDGFNQRGHSVVDEIVDRFSHDDPEYLMGRSDGEGDLEILSNRTPN